MSECTVLTLSGKLKNENLHLVDVREYAEYAGGRVAGASLLPLGELESRRAELDRTKPIYVICRTGRRAAEAQ
jgi:rhodanese-related sulfurtransferase